MPPLSTRFCHCGQAVLFIWIEDVFEGLVGWVYQKQVVAIHLLMFGGSRLQQRERPGR
jgi:hypothetical protein